MCVCVGGGGGGGGAAPDVCMHVYVCLFVYVCILDVLYFFSLQIELSDIWKKKYEQWLEVEVYSSPHDWDTVLQSPQAFMELKAMEF